MGVRTMYDPERKVGTLYCDTADVPFGPVMYADSREDMVAFLTSVTEKFELDARLIDPIVLAHEWHLFAEKLYPDTVLVYQGDGTYKELNS